MTRLLFASLPALVLAVAPVATQTLVKDIQVTASDPGSDPTQMAAIGGMAYFDAADPTHGSELWASDGTIAGTALLADIRPGPEGSDPLGWTALGSSVLFSADDGVSGRELWITDGTSAGTRLLADINPN